MTEYAGLLMTEPLSATLLIGAVLAFLRASDDNDWRWAGAAGLLAGALTLVRAEFIVLLLLLPLLALVRRPHELRAAALPAAAIALGAVLVIAPWTIRNASALDRFVPVSTGGGKTLYIGTNLEADGDAVKLRGDLLAEYPQLAERLERRGPVDDPANYALERLLLRVASDEDPGADPDEVLARLGREQLGDAITEHPGEFIGLLWSKTYDTWTQPARETMDLLPWRILQFALIFGALGGLVILAVRRRFEALVLGVVLLFITAVGALLIASPRRALTAMPLVCALAAAGFTLACAAARSKVVKGSDPLILRAHAGVLSPIPGGELVACLHRAPRPPDPGDPRGDPPRGGSVPLRAGHQPEHRSRATTPSPTWRSPAPSMRSSPTAARSSTTRPTGRPGAPLLYAGVLLRDGRRSRRHRPAHPGAARDRRDLPHLPAGEAPRRARGRPARRRGSRRLPAVHLLDRRRPQRAAGASSFCPQRSWRSSGRRDRGGTWPWLLPGALLGVMSLIRPEYMFVGDRPDPVVALATLWRERGPRLGGRAATAALAVAFALAILPWTVRNYIDLDRVVPISTGSGKALYVGTSLPNDGEYFRVKASLVERFQGRTLDPDSEELDDVDPTPLFDRVADRVPGASPATRR